MRSALWLVYKELLQRRVSFVGAVALVAVSVTLCVSLELVSRSREIAVSAEVDHMGPPIQIIPAGRSAADLARHELGRTYLPERFAYELQRTLSPRLRALERRLLLTESIGGRATLVAGLAPGSVISPVARLKNLRKADVLVGATLSQRLNIGVGDTLTLRERRLRVTGVLPLTSTPRDLTLFLSLARLQTATGLVGRVNELRVYPLRGSFHRAMVAQIRDHRHAVQVVQRSRGAVADRGIADSLRKNRWLLYLILSVMVAVSLLVFSFLNAGERGMEMATMIAIGGRSAFVFVVLALRAALVGWIGALSGYTAAVLINLAQDYDSAIHAVGSVGLAASVVGAAVFLSVLGAVPVSIRLATQKHVNALRDLNA